VLLVQPLRKAMKNTNNGVNVILASKDKEYQILKSHHITNLTGLAEK